MDFHDIKTNELIESDRVASELVHALRLELNKFMTISRYLDRPIPSKIEELSFRLKNFAQSHEILYKESELLCSDSHTTFSLKK